MGVDERAWPHPSGELGEWSVRRLWLVSRESEHPLPPIPLCRELGLVTGRVPGGEPGAAGRWGPLSPFLDAGA